MSKSETKDLPDPANKKSPHPRSRRFGKAAFSAAILGPILVAVVPVIYAVGMISVIGIPLALIAVLLPTICLLVLLAYLVWRLFFPAFRWVSPLRFSLHLQSCCSFR